MKRVSLKDIALKAGVSISTVSFVLNNKGQEMRISKEQAKKVKEIAKTMGYRPNLLAKGLRTGSSKTIGLIVENISNQFFASVAKVIEDECQSYGYKVFYCSTDNDDKKARTLINRFLDTDVEGFIITPTEHIKAEISYLMQIKKPLVLLDRYFTSVDTSYVIMNNYEMTYKAITNLIKKGYRNIAFVSNDIKMLQMTERHRGYREALADNGLRYTKTRVFQLQFGLEKSVLLEKVASFINKDPDLDAIFFGTNTLGIIGMEVLRSLKKRVPQDLAIISFDDHDLFRLSNPAISVIEQPVKKLGSQAVRILMKLIAEKGTGATYHIVEQGKIIERESY